MDDELELNLTIPSVPQRSSKPPSSSKPRKDGGAKPNDNRPKASAKPAAPMQRSKPNGNGKSPAPRQTKGRPFNGRQQPTSGQSVKPTSPAKQARPPQKQPQTTTAKKGRSERIQQRPGKERFKRSAGGGGTDPDDPDELLRAPEPEDEQEDDLRAAMSLMAKREAALKQEELAAAAARGGKAARAPAAEREGVVEFDDDDDGGGRHKRRRLNEAGAGKGGAVKATGRGNYTPGTLVHAAAAAAGTAAAAAAAASDGTPAASGGGEWRELGLAASLSSQLESLGFAAPTPIQRAVLPVLMAGRDALVRAQTGSGKTLSYLLPIINDLQGQQPRISRGEGTFALVLAPTRELSIQVHDVAAALLKRYFWLVSGLLIGGENRQHEKARLRKGVALLVASPGRLLDHLEKTASFRTSELRWLVLDEADRLLDLGFEARLRQIAELLDRGSGAAAVTGSGAGAEQRQQQQQRHTEEEAEEEEEEEPGSSGQEDAEGSEEGDEEEGGRRREKGRSSKGAGADGGSKGGGGGGGERRQTVLLSATLHKQLGALAELALRDPALVGFEMRLTGNGVQLLTNGTSQPNGGGGAAVDDDPLSTYSLPASLRQTWIEVPAKERLVALTALLRSRTSRRRVGGTRAVVFVASCDEVEFLHHVLGDMWEAAAGAPLLPPGVRLFKLHGDMPQSERTETFAGFAKEGDGVLLCTDVAARGLDFPNVTLIVQYDVPGAPSEYVHRVGRSARMGAAGEAVMLLMPHEVPYVNLLRSRGVLLEPDQLDKLARWMPSPPADQVRPIKRKGAAAAEAAASGGAAARQLAQQLHRQVAAAVSRDPHAAKLAHDAFRSFVRAYATHSGDLKRVFAVRNLHLGHVAHSFLLVETPTTLGTSAAAADRKRRKRETVMAQEVERRKKMKRAARRVTS